MHRPNGSPESDRYGGGGWVDGRRIDVDCVAGFYGDVCSEVNACLLSVSGQSACQQGDCISTGNGTYFCQCRRGWYGADCSQYNPCIVSPCLNDATCVSPESTVYRCICLDGYYGNRCELHNACTAQQSAQLCRNGATCHNTSDGNFTCECANG